MRFQKGEFCKNWDFQCVNFWIKCGFLPQCGTGGRRESGIMYKFFENETNFMVALVPMVLGIFDGLSNNCRTGLLGLGILFRQVLKE